MKEGTTRSKIVLFDLDGTIIDSTEAILESFATAFDSFGVAVPPAQTIKDLIGLPLDVMFEKLGVAQDDAMAYVKVYKAHYQSVHTQKTTLLPRAKEAVEFAHAYARLGVVTTKTSEYSRILLEHFDLMQYFDVLIGREDVEHPKPHPEPVYKALGQLGYRFGKVTYFVGDTTIDMLAAQEAGIGSIGVLTGYMDEEALDEVADFVVSDAFEASRLIEKL
ncbi:MAG: hydrolase [Sulfurovum sp. 28-43-6]|jgi:phosphoglycolate phosphatase|nr:MAG: hydrolase [Sulfurovum sp. 35-42-20]OYY55843.1 MAG: hydrolase [Sulfurovum sp. 28-43-6]OYZ26341.1 MAG: hydrolase [Sulfurovum sp. 16-42-52]OYZ49998.1 MAG: hydrolase [Sulfurovum sp. 24-42-9]OZA46588.1 MAG: hydrolase [Sulfurovum sp. 17-42-90]OZA59983.1 MAG: hydrolase [Sulfurovum sp. 39-42-12]HQR73547.1 HAD family hydrolase [Sulfurovum sp.]